MSFYFLNNRIAITENVDVKISDQKPPVKPFETFSVSLFFIYLSPSSFSSYIGGSSCFLNQTVYIFKVVSHFDFCEVSISSFLLLAILPFLSHLFWYCPLYNTRVFITQDIHLFSFTFRFLLIWLLLILWCLRGF